MNVSSFAKLDSSIRPHVSSPKKKNVYRKTQKPEKKKKKRRLEILFYF